MLRVGIYGAGTLLGRSFTAAETTRRNVPGAGLTMGTRADASLWILNVGALFKYGLHGPDFIPSYFDATFEAERLSPPRREVRG